jgi:hypothetical protein
MNKLWLCITLLLVVGFATPAADPIDRVATLLRQGNVHELATLFAESVDVSVLDEANVYSKAQAEVILDKFFTQNKPGGVRVLHKVNSNPNYLFGVLLVTSGRSSYRVAVTLRGAGGSLSLIELRIEAAH